MFGMIIDKDQRFDTQVWVHVQRICKVQTDIAWNEHLWVGGGIAQLVSHLPLNLGTCVRIPVGAWLRSTNAWMRGEEITSCKGHIASVILTNWCILIKKNTNVWVILWHHNIKYDVIKSHDFDETCVAAGYIPTHY